MSRLTTLLTLMFAGALLTSGAERRIPIETYRAKVYASWLGQVIGNVYGLPHENAYIDKPGPETFPYGYSKNLQRLRRSNGAFSDDDTDIEYLYLLAMEKYGAEPTYAQLAELWKHHVRDAVWLANRSALAAMHFGYTPPETGNKARNPHWFQIDPQLISEIWAVTAPGMVRYAAEKSDWAARIMTDDWGVEPTIHYGAMYSAAFFEKDVRKLIDIGTAALPKNSRFAGVVEHMKALHAKYPNDWKQARAEMARKYYIDEPADTKTIWNAQLNGAAGILALLYGNGDFQRTLDLSCAMGFDADNQAATMSGLIGLIGGVEALPRELLFPLPELNWKEPFNDVYKNVSRYDMPDASLKDMAARMAAMGEKIVLAHGGRKVTENGVEYLVIDSDARFVAPLELPAGPAPYLAVKETARYAVPVTGGAKPYRWELASALPPGLQFRNGVLSGVPSRAGVYSIGVRVRDTHHKAERAIPLVVRGANLAAAASGVLSRVRQPDVASRDAMWLTVAYSLYAGSVDVIRDGKRSGAGSTFYSINGKETGDVTDFYGYEWSKPVEIGLVEYSAGPVEENGGWFTSLNVEYRDQNGAWSPVRNLIVNPPLAPGNGPFNKPHFADYLLAFEPVKTTAVRIIGKAGSAKHWKSSQIPFTSITELGVYGPLPDYQLLK